MKIALAQINSTVGDFDGNFAKIRAALAQAKDADLVVFPEAALCGYPQQDLLDYPSFAEKSEAYAERLLKEESSRSFIFGSVGKNIGTGRPCKNLALFADRGKWLARYEKRLLPSYDVFDEDRFFEPGRSASIVEFKSEKMALTVCEDIWNKSSSALLQNRYAQSPVDEMQGAKILINISASPYESAKVKSKREMLSALAKKYQVSLVYTNCVGANDGIIFDGRSYVWSPDGAAVAEGKAFAEDLIYFDTAQLKPVENKSPEEISDLYDALVLGIQDYSRKQGFTSAVLGLSGGIDSAVVLCLAVDALGAENVSSVMLPSRYTGPASMEDSIKMASLIRNPLHILSIEEVFQASLRTLEKAFEGMQPDVTEENLQARSRGILLMGLSNKFGMLLLTTGNKSELAVGYCTLYGDMCGGLAPISDVYKMQVYALGREANRRQQRIPERVFTRAPTAELRPNQKDQDSLPPYERLDAILKMAIEECKSPENCISAGFEKTEVEKIYGWLGKTEYKRFQMPVGLKVSSKAFGIGRRLPVVQKFL